MKSGHLSYESAAGTVQVMFALNNWVLVQLPNGRSEQRQVPEERELVLVLQDLGLSEAEAREAAAAAWRERPFDAGLRDARPGESPVRGSGLPVSWIVVALVIFVLLAVYAFVHVYGRS